MAMGLDPIWAQIIEKSLILTMGSTSLHWVLTNRSLRFFQWAPQAQSSILRRRPKSNDG